MMLTFRHKRGDTFRQVIGLFADDDLTLPVDGSTLTVAGGAIRHASGVETPLAVSMWSELPAQVLVECDAATSASLQPGLWRGDIQFSDGGGAVISSQTFQILIEEDYA